MHFIDDDSRSQSLEVCWPAANSSRETSRQGHYMIYSHRHILNFIWSNKSLINELQKALFQDFLHHLPMGFLPNSTSRLVEWWGHSTRLYLVCVSGKTISYSRPVLVQVHFKSSVFEHNERPVWMLWVPREQGNSMKNGALNLTLSSSVPTPYYIADLARC
jgi:hypothetical protein